MRPPLAPARRSLSHVVKHNDDQDLVLVDVDHVWELERLFPLQEWWAPYAALPCSMGDPEGFAVSWGSFCRSCLFGQIG